MPVTRAALRAQAPEDRPFIHEDSDADVSHTALTAALDLDMCRPPLRDITWASNPSEGDGSSYETVSTDQCANGKPIVLVHKEDVAGTVEQLEASEVLHPGEARRDGPDDDVEQPCLETSPRSSPKTVSDLAGNRDTKSPPASDAGQNAPCAAAAALTPRIVRSEPPKTPRFDPEVHQSGEETLPPEMDASEDSFIAKIKSRGLSGTNTPCNSNVPSAPTTLDAGNTPHTPRIEDSVEAMDALEEAIEQVSGTLPALRDLPAPSPVKGRKSTATSTTPRQADRPNGSPKAVSSHTPKGHGTLGKPNLTARPGHPAKPYPSRPAIAKQASKPSVTTGPTTSLHVAKQGSRESSTTAPRPTSGSRAPAKQSLDGTKRRLTGSVLSTSKPGFVPAKSAKPPTRSTFSLPGEAMSAKFKAQREERLRRQEAAEAAKKTFKARPVPSKPSRPSVVPRENKASQARMSVNTTGVNKENVAPRVPSAVRASSTASGPAAPTRGRPMPSTSDRRGPDLGRQSSVKLATAQKPAVPRDEAALEKGKAKAVFSRNLVDPERLEKERKEKEAATRKARAEAAERGRQASREWAEKQRKKMAMQAAPKLAEVKKLGTASIA